MKNEEISKNIVGEKEYMKIHKDLNDSIILWSSLKLETWRNYKIYEDVIIDKIICFNLFKNKFVTASLERNFENPKLDGITYIYGVKIDSNWYFFQGAHIVLPREMYQKEVTKLHEIALKEVFAGYLKKKEPIVSFWKFWQKQEYEVDESYFDKHFRGQGWGGGDWIEDPDGSNGHWNGRIYTDEEFNKMYKEKALSVWPSSNPLTSFYDINIKRWRNIPQDSFDILLKAKKINPNGTAVE